MRGDAGPSLCPDTFRALEEALAERPELGLEASRAAGAGPER